MKPNNAFSVARGTLAEQRLAADISVTVCESDVFEEAMVDRRFTPMQAAQYDQDESMRLFRERLAREISRQVGVEIGAVRVATMENRPRNIGPCGGECLRKSRCKAGQRFECCRVIIGGALGLALSKDRVEALVRRAKMDAWWDVESWLTKKEKGAIIVPISEAGGEAIKASSIEELVLLFEANERQQQADPSRVWWDIKSAIMDELAERNEAAFVAWTWSNEDSPRTFFTPVQRLKPGRKAKQVVEDEDFVLEGVVA